MSQAANIPLLPPPPGLYALAISGGADSTALLFLLHGRPGLALHLVHLNHELRGPASDADMRFVQRLADRLSLPRTLARRSEIEPTMPNLPANPSARWRAIRLELYRRVIAEHQLDGVLLAHHADDQAETILFRLLRGAGPAGLTGMVPEIRVNGTRLLRPLLHAWKRDLQNYLRSINESWREDASNASPRYARNRLRVLLRRHPDLGRNLLELGESSRRLVAAAARAAPALPTPFDADELRRLPSILARESARNWLLGNGVPRGECSSKVIERLIEMATDAASPARRHFPGKLPVARRQGRIAPLRDG